MEDKREDEDKSLSPPRATPICAIGASAGGVTALQALFDGLEDGLGFAYVVIIHLSPEHESRLSEVLASCTGMPVSQVEDSPRLEPNCVYVIAPDRELVIDGDLIHSRPFTEPRGQRAPIDMFFRSIAAARGDGLCVVLSGAGSDGAVGVTRVKEAGGLVLVQDPREAEFGTMPRSAIATGAADFVEPIDGLAARIGEIARSKDALRDLRAEEVEDDLRRIMAFVRSRTGHDFSSYKRATVMRRITRRMQVARMRSLADYADYLHRTPEEAQELFGDLLISVTSFFRDPAAYESLVERAIAPMLIDRDADTQVRVWSVGCATGEEAYSVAIVLLEEAERQGVTPEIQIFASDLDEGALATAREGRYPKAIEADVSDARLRRFFIDEGTHYRIRKEVRDTVIFAHHSVLRDPPFMHLDLIVCRNLLIYLKRELQRQLLVLFHYGLRPGGMLFLGSAESVDMQPDFFQTCDREARVFVARPRTSREVDILTQLPADHRLPRSSTPAHVPEAPRQTSREMHAASLEQLAPPSALVDEAYRVLNLSKTAGWFIRPSEGPLNTELPELVRPELRSELRSALYRAFRAGEPTLTLSTSVQGAGARRRVTMHVLPRQEGPQAARTALVMFLDAGPGSDAETEEGEDGAAEGGAAGRIRLLEAELKATQARLSESRREHEGAIHDLRAANEELQSINEEYRSTAEELETSKEELQSINEELSTVNFELKTKLDAIASAHSDLQNLVNATEIGTLFLDGDLRIKMLTPAVEQLFNVTDSDVGRPITDFTHKLAKDGVERLARKVLKDLAPVETEVATKDGRWLMMRLRPYRTVEDRIEGVVLSFVDITERLETETRLRESEEKHSRLFENMDEGYLLAKVMRDTGGAVADIHYIEANPAAVRMVKADFAGRRLSEVDAGFEPHWLELPDRVVRTGKAERMELFAEPLGQWFDVGVTKIDDERAAILFKDVTERKRSESERELMLAELNHRVKNMLAVVQSIANQTADSTEDPKEFAGVFGKRVRALAGAHDVLTQEHWTGAHLKQLVGTSLTTFAPDGSDRIDAEGPDVRLSPNAAVSLSMALHELGTNALKYGALSTDRGRIRIRWTFEEGASRLLIEWNEQDGPGVMPPKRWGFGTRLLEKGIAYELAGKVDLDYASSGLVCRMAFPAERVIAHDGR